MNMIRFKQPVILSIIWVRTTRRLPKIRKFQTEFQATKIWSLWNSTLCTVHLCSM